MHDSEIQTEGAGQPAQEELTFNGIISIKRERRGRQRIVPGLLENFSDSLPEGRVPHLSRLMALAINLDDRLKQGEFKDFAEIAQLGHITRARATQIMNLRLLAPDIQEEILFLPVVMKGRAPISERDFRPIVAEPDWALQRQMWRNLKQDRLSA